MRKVKKTSNKKAKAMKKAYVQLSWLKASDSRTFEEFCQDGS